jgi:serine/threonine protein kinase
VLKCLGGRAGIVPLIDSGLPDYPTRETPAWFAMPEAIPIVEQLKRTPGLDAVVNAVASVARTLAEIWAEKSIAHRDVKLANILWLSGRTCIGDFGLAHFPGKSRLTRPGAKLGPIGFIAPEMLYVGSGDLDSRGDVYSLAKTLWALGTSREWPPPGEIRRANPEDLLSSQLVDRRARPLDALLEEATRRDPSARPSMGEFAAALERWTTDPGATLGVRDPDATSTVMEELGAIIDKWWHVFASAMDPEEAKELRRYVLRASKDQTLALGRYGLEEVKRVADRTRSALREADESTAVAHSTHIEATAAWELHDAIVDLAEGMA